MGGAPSALGPGPGPGPAYPPCPRPPAASGRSGPANAAPAGREEAELALALALSAAESAGPRPGHGPGSAEALQLEAALAQSLAESRSREQRRRASGPEAARGSATVIGTPVIGTPAPRPGACAGCDRPFNFLGGTTVNALGRRWHRECFRCAGCNQPLDEPSFCVEAGRPYHQRCWRRACLPVCRVCDEHIPVGPDNRAAYKKSLYWGDAYCPRHDEDGTRTCTGCRRLERRRDPHSPLADGRSLCPDCVLSVVVDTKDAEPLFREVREFFETLNLRLPDGIPLHLVDDAVLNDAQGRGGGGHSHGHGQVLGVTLSEERRTVEYGWGRQPRVLGTAGHVSAILVLSGLPRLLCGSVLAHECFHAFVRGVQNVHHLSLDVEEGLAQLMAYLWLERQRPSSAWEVELRAYHLNMIHEHSSLTYGDGFRAAYQTYHKWGLPRVIEHVRLTGELPVA